MRYPPLTTAGAGSGRSRAWPPPLIAVAHGSRDPGAARAISRLAGLTAALASRTGLPGLTVRVAYLGHARPSVPEVLTELDTPDAVVLPLLLTGAYHSDTDLPAVLREARATHPGLRLHYGAPLGPHPGLLRALERRLAQAGVPSSPAHASGTAVVLASAGSSRPDANAAVARTARAWQSARGWRRVVPAYASAAAPGPGEAVAALRRDGEPRVVVATYLLAPGVFAHQVREQALAAGARAVSIPLGAASEVAGVLLERYLQAVPPSLPSCGISAAL